MPRKRVQDWSPRGRRPGARVPELQAIPVEMVGDGGSPNIYFVTRQGDVLLISLDFDAAYSFWKSISRTLEYETGLEDRQHGTLAAVEPRDDADDAPLIRYDDTHMLRRGDV